MQATYHLRSWHQDFDGNRQPDVGLANRSWVDSTGLTADQLAIKLPELDAKLSGAIEPSVKKRKYNWERDQTMRLLAERGNSLARISWIRRWPLTFSAIVLLGPEDVVPLMEQAVNEVIKDPHVSLFVVCHSGQCDEYRSINNQFLKEMLFGSHQRLLEAKVTRCNAGGCSDCMGTGVSSATSNSPHRHILFSVAARFSHSHQNAQSAASLVLGRH